MHGVFSWPRHWQERSYYAHGGFEHQRHYAYLARDVICRISSARRCVSRRVDWIIACKRHRESVEMTYADLYDRRLSARKWLNYFLARGAIPSLHPPCCTTPSISSIPLAETFSWKVVAHPVAKFIFWNLRKRNELVELDKGRKYFFFFFFFSLSTLCNEACVYFDITRCTIETYDLRNTAELFYRISCTIIISS